MKTRLRVLPYAVKRVAENAACIRLFHPFAAPLVEFDGLSRRRDRVVDRAKLQVEAGQVSLHDSHRDDVRLLRRELLRGTVTAQRFFRVPLLLVHPAQIVQSDGDAMQFPDLTHQCAGLLACDDRILGAADREIRIAEVSQYSCLTPQVTLISPDGKGPIKAGDAVLSSGQADVGAGQAVAQVSLAIGVPGTASGLDAG